MSILALLVAQTPISHGDPGINNDSNVMPFRMQEVLYERPTPQIPIEDDEDHIGMEPDYLQIANLRKSETALIRMVTNYPLPFNSALADALQQLSAEEFVASAFVYSLIAQLNSLNGGNGAGLFEGKGRYDMLLKRLSIVSNQFNSSFFTLYSSLLNELRIGEALPAFVDQLYPFAGLPRGLQQAVIAILGKERQSVVSIARAWHKAIKEARENNPDWEKWDSIYYDPTGKVSGSSLDDAEAAIPHISGNAFRHSIFREILCMHLLQVLEFGSVGDVTKNNSMPPYVIQLFSNGGNMAAKASAPDNSEAVTAAIKRTFPSLELVSGVLPTHIMGEGALRVANWTLCLQNNPNTSPYGYRRDVEAASTLTIITHARHTPDGMESSKEAGAMLFAHTAMKPGTRILMKIDFHPFASELAKGAAYFAFKEWIARGAQVGGREGTGAGHFLVPDISIRPSSTFEDESLEQYEDYAQQYQEYVQINKEVLREALMYGTLGWRERLKAWG
jgi:hypothetical protein